MNKHFRGFTLIELLVVVAVTAVLVFLAVPGFQNMTEKRRVVAAAESIHNLLSLALSESVRLQTPVYANFKTEEATSKKWAAGLSVTHNCDPNSNIDDITACVMAEAGEPILRTVTSEQFVATSMISAFFGVDDVSETCFEPVRRTAADENGKSLDGMIRMQSASGRFELVIQVTETGHILMCNPPTSAPVLGYPQC